MMPNPRRYVPSISGLCTSLRLRGKEFLRENTLHGFRYFVNPRRPLWERIAWFVCTVVSIGAVIGIIVTILKTFRKNPTLVSLDTETEDLVLHFPSVALCKRNPDLNYGPAYKPDAEHYNSMYEWSWKPIKDERSSDVIFGDNYSDIFYRAAPNCEDLYKDCTYSGRPVSCSRLFRKIVMTRGICCFVDATRMSKDSRPWDLSFRTNAYPISLDILEEKDGSPPARQAPFSYYLTSGVTLRILIILTRSTSGLASLPARQRKCLLPEEGSSYNACLHRCQINRTIDVCDCVPWFLIVPADNGTRECTRRDYDCLVDKKEILERPDCGCYLSCDHASHEFDHLEHRRDNVVEIQIINWPSVLYKLDVRFGWLDMLVSFGGIAGLFVGYSLLTTVELAYYLSLRSYCGAVLAKPENTIRIKVATLPSRRLVKVVRLNNDYYPDYLD